MKYVVVGAGSRGMIYGTLAKNNGIRIAAIAEKRPDRLLSAADALDVPESMRFSEADDLFAMGRSPMPPSLPHRTGTITAM